jgi:serpin B
MKRLMKERRRGLSTLLILCLMLLLTAHAEAPATEKPYEGLEVYFLDLGRVDGILIRCGGENCFIDVGFKESAKPAIRFLRAMGITHLFDPARADFSPSLNTPACLASAIQSIQVAVDEKGVTAAAYIALPTPGSAQPPKEIIEFVLDRPFLFVITKDQIPLFAGVINQV